MKTLAAAILAGITICGLSLAQNTTPPPNASQSQQESAPLTTMTTPSAASSPGQNSASPRIAPGSVIPVQLTKSIDAKKVKSGDSVEAKVTQDLKAASGELIVAKDTKVVGHITETQVRNKDQKESQLGIAFDHAVMKNGNDVQLPMSIQAIIAPPTASPNNDNVGGQSPAPHQTPGAPTATGSGSGRMDGTGTGMPAAGVPVPSTAGDVAPTSAQSGSNSRPPISGNTQGVVGISNMKLAAAQDPAQGSVVSSEKNNVKLESGTFLLLRVNP